MAQSCYVEQGRYGLPVKKPTWLYAYGVELQELRWGYTPDGESLPEQWTKGQHRGGHHGLTAITPPEFRDVLLAIARSANEDRPRRRGRVSEYVSPM